MYICISYMHQQVFTANTRSLGAMVLGNPFGIGGAAPFDSGCDGARMRMSHHFGPYAKVIHHGSMPCLTAQRYT